jgi:hypothetical protein
MIVIRLVRKIRTVLGTAIRKMVVAIALNGLSTRLLINEILFFL